MKANKKIKTEWNLSQFYKSVGDPRIDSDMKRMDIAFSTFEKKYKSNNKFIKDETILFKALKELEDLSLAGFDKPYRFLSYYRDLDSKNEKVIARLNLISQEYNKISNKTVFFDVQLSKIDKKSQEKFLKNEKLKHFRYLLKKTFDKSKYILTEPEEKILSLKSLTSEQMWVDMTEKLLSKSTVNHKDREIALSEASNLIADIPTQKERIKLHKKISQVQKKYAEVAEAELNAIVTDKKIDDELRGLKEAFDGTILRYENDRNTVMNLVKTVTDSFTVSQRFYKVKAKMLKLKTLSYADRAAGVGKKKEKITFAESFERLHSIFHSLSPRFGEILDRMSTNGQIDVYPKVGKRGGAYCSHGVNTPTMVMLNHTDTFKSLMTFAHEMGHAIHSEFCKVQSPSYQHYSMSTAEVASTLFEMFTFYDALEKMTEKEKIIALHDKIQDDIATIFRQVACFNFEVDMHNSIRLKGNLSVTELCHMMNKHMKAYLGPVFKLEEEDGLMFVSWPHLRYMFYVYSYAFGQLASKALYQKYSEDKKYIDKIGTFLSLGGSMSPEDVFKSIGVDVKKPDFWKLGIKSIEKDIELLEKLTTKK